MKRFPTMLALALVITCLAVSDVLAQEPAGFTRADFSAIMRWVNFGILAGLIIKYARRPIAGFLKDKKEEVAGSIHKLEEEKRGMEQQISEIHHQLAAGQKRLEVIKEKIIAQGQRRKEELIAEAQDESRILLESARFKIDIGIKELTQRFRTEMIDMAADLAAESVQRRITPQNHEHLVAQWLEAAAK